MRVSTAKTEIYVDDERQRQQRAGLFLRDVSYRVHTDMEVLSDESPAKYETMFERRAAKGQCFNQPYLGCREFTADFRLAEPNTGAPPIGETRDLGWMLYDLDYSDPTDPPPRFFQARLDRGIVLIPDGDGPEVRG